MYEVSGFLVSTYIKSIFRILLCFAVTMPIATTTWKLFKNISTAVKKYQFFVIV